MTTYDTIEESLAAARPYWLYSFNDGISSFPTQFTSDEEDIIIDDEVWTHSPIDGGDIEINGNIERQDIDLTFPLNDAFARIYLDVAYAITTLTIFRGHHSDPTNTLSVHWKGRIVGAVSAAETIKISAESIFTSMRRVGNRARCQRQCRYALYRPGCDLVRSDFEEACTITALNGLTLTCPEAALAPANDFKAGIVNWNGIFGMVAIHSGDQLTLLSKIPGLEAYIASTGSADVLVSPGCSRVRSRCDDRFDNSLNFGGFDRLPTLNPFSTSIV